VADALRFIKPPQRALIFAVAQAASFPRPVVKPTKATYRSVEEAVKEVIIKARPSCRGESPADVAARFFWHNC
jgi:hypothetical protein